MIEIFLPFSWKLFLFKNISVSSQFLFSNEIPFNFSKETLGKFNLVDFRNNQGFIYFYFTGTPTSLIFGQDSEMGVLKECNTIAHELVPIVTNSNIHQFHSVLPEMLDNCPDLQQFGEQANDPIMLPQLELLQNQQQPLASPPPTQINVLTGVYTLQEEPEEMEENTTM